MEQASEKIFTFDQSQWSGEFDQGTKVNQSGRFELLSLRGQTKRTAETELLKIRQQERDGKKSIVLRYLRALQMQVTMTVPVSRGALLFNFLLVIKFSWKDITAKVYL